MKDPRRATRTGGLWIAAAVLALPAASHAQQGGELAVAERVFAEIALQFPHGSPPPALELREGSGEPAVFDPRRSAIVLDRSAYEVARSLGADSLNALAYLLGHELAHYYDAHAQRFRFRQLFRGLSVVDTLADRQFERRQQLQFETEADLTAGFAAYLAGYDPLPGAPEFLRALYTTFGLDPDHVGSHPPLADRVQVADMASRQLDRLVQVFEGGVSLLIIGRYHEAGRVFEQLAREFPSREVLNNAGTARALEALAILGDVVAWAYPFELDVETRLERDRDLGFADSRAEAARLLREAGHFFEQARLRDPSYTSAYVNLAGVNQLLGEPEFATAYVGRALALAEAGGEPASRAHALVVRGIVRAESGDAGAARADFEAASAASPAFAAANLTVLDGGEATLAFASDERLRFFSTESIAGIPGDVGGEARAAVDAALRRMGGRPDVELTIRASAGRPEIGIYAERFEDARAFIIGSAASRVLLVLATADGYAGESAAGIKPGDALDRVLAEYGSAGQVIATRQGAYHVFPRAQIAFAVDPEQRVTGWLTWHVSE